MGLNRRVLLAGLALQAPSTKASDDDLVVGQVAQLADPNAVGNHLRRGCQWLLDAVNRQGGIHGRRVVLVARHRGPQPADTLRETRALLAQSQPIALLNLMGTGSMETLKRDGLLQREGIPVVGIRSGAISLHTPVHPWLFHTRASYRIEVRRALQHFRTIGARRVAVVREESAYGQELKRLVDEEITNDMTATWPAPLDVSAPDTSSAARAVAALMAEAVLIGAPSPLTADFYAALRSRHVAAHVTALSTTDAIEVVKRLGPARAHGLAIVQVVPDPSSPASGLSREFRALVGQARAAPQEVTQAALEGYIATRVLVEGLRRAGPRPTRASLRRSLEGLDLLDLGGFAVGFAPDSHSGSRFADIGVLDVKGRLRR